MRRSRLWQTTIRAGVGVRAPSFALGLAFGLVLFAFALAEIALVARGANPTLGPGAKAKLRSGKTTLLLDLATGSVSVDDSTSGQKWGEQPPPKSKEAGPDNPLNLLPLGVVEFELDGKRVQAPLQGLQQVASKPGTDSKPNSDALRLTWQPKGAEAKNGERLDLRIEAGPFENSFTLSWEAGGGLKAHRLRLFSGWFRIPAADPGGVVIPAREGLWIPAFGTKAFTQRFETSAYEGCHMNMGGIVKGGSTALITWNDWESALELSRSTNGPQAALVLVYDGPGERGSCTVRFTGPGDYNRIASAYRQTAQRSGWRVPWSTKIAENPSRTNLFGAINFKLWSALDREMNEESTVEKRSHVNWTFAEAAEIAGHLRRDLGLDHVLFSIGGWIRRGYDNQHPDVLPAAPECGGNEALAQCSASVRSLGYLFGLHDNYQDMYKDAPSWDEKYLIRHRDGSIAKGGIWAGGRAYVTCSKMALELARRPGNLVAVRALTGANAYFIDTTYASGLWECFAPDHPATRADDVHWKQALSDEARRVFGIFGSECGREWAIPHSDFFEGLSGVSGTHYHNRQLPDHLQAVPIPLFEMVYHDCIAIYGKYGYEPSQAADYVLQHLLYGRTLNYHSTPEHLYWKQPFQTNERLGLTARIASIKPTPPNVFSIQYAWRGVAPKEPGWKVFVHFCDASGSIAFQNDHDIPTALLAAQAGNVKVESVAAAGSPSQPEVLDGPYEVTIPAEQNGPFAIRLGLFKASDMSRALLSGPTDGERRIKLGLLRREGPNLLHWQPEMDDANRETGDPAMFLRGDNGWTDGLHPWDRFVKNTAELTSPLHFVTAEMLIEEHRLLTPDGAVQSSRFGKGADAVTVTINQGRLPYSTSSKLGGRVLLPAKGFLVDSARFVAFHASTWGGMAYTDAPMFTLRSMDGAPLAQSKRIRVFHGFGDEHLSLSGRSLRVQKELLFEAQPR